MGDKPMNIMGGQANILISDEVFETWKCLHPDIKEGWVEGARDTIYDGQWSEKLGRAWRVVERMQALELAGEHLACWYNFKHGNFQRLVLDLPAKEAALAICRAAVISMLPAPSLAETFAKLGELFKDADFSAIGDE